MIFPHANEPCSLRYRDSLSSYDNDKVLIITVFMVHSPFAYFFLITIYHIRADQSINLWFNDIQKAWFNILRRDAFSFAEK